MRNTFLVVIFILMAKMGSAQVQNPVKWSFSSKKVNATTYELHLTASIDGHWHVYSQTTPDGGPIPTSISFTKNPLIAMVGPAKEVGKLEQKAEPLFGVDVKQFSNKVDFVQTVTVKGKVKTSVTGSVEYMTCNDEQCLPPKSQKFSIALK